MFLKFLKYFFWGIVGFFLQTHLRLPFDFFALSLAAAFFVLNGRYFLTFSLGLALFYGTYSLAAWTAWFVPGAAVFGLLHLWKALKDFSAPIQRVSALTFFLLAEWAWGVAWYGWTAQTPWSFLQVWLGTLLLGLGVIPLGPLAWKKILASLPRSRPAMGELSLYMGPDRISKSQRFRGIRRPFSLERG